MNCLKFHCLFAVRVETGRREKTTFEAQKVSFPGNLKRAGLQLTCFVLPMWVN